MMSGNHYDRLRSLKTYFGTIYEEMCDLDMKDQKKKKTEGNMWTSSDREILNACQFV